MEVTHGAQRGPSVIVYVRRGRRGRASVPDADSVFSVCAFCLAEGDEGAAGHPPGQRARTHRGPAAAPETTHRDQGTRPPSSVGAGAARRLADGMFHSFSRLIYAHRRCRRIDGRARGCQALPTATPRIWGRVLEGSPSHCRPG